MAASKGHAEHTQASDTQVGFPGAMPRPIRVVMIGAGSSFTPRLTNDLLLIPGADRGVIALVDVDRGRLRPMQKLIQKLLDQLGRNGWKVEASTNRREMLKGADYVVNSIEVHGLECVPFDNKIPLKYGIDQCIGDTIGPGGLFKGLRTIPVWLKILQDVEDVCPNALVLNYTNPMNMMCLAAARATSVEVAGMCHSVQGTSHLLARRAKVSYEQMEWECAGINHLAWFTTLKHRGRDLYPRLKRMARRDLDGDPANPEDTGDLVRKDVMLHFGAFVTESSGHLSEYLPYYRKRKDLMKKYCRERYDGESLFYARNWPKWRASADRDREAMLAGRKPVGWKRSWEYASWIIEGREKDHPFRFHGNVPNTWKGGGPLIANLDPDGCVEVACTVDRNGFNPSVYGRLPAQMAALCASNMRMFDLAATAALEKSKEAAIHALMLDPLTSAVCSPAEIRDLTLELFDAEKQYLRGYR